jgi:hypothetical protein
MMQLFTRGALAHDLRVAVVAVAAASLVVAAPKVVDTVANADKVDGKHAVGAGASLNQRAGKLVATNSQGRLPDNIIKRVPKAVPGQVLKGEWGAWGGGAGSYVETSVPFGQTLPVAIPGARFTVLNNGETTTECPGPGRVVPRGWLCVYTVTQGNVSGLNGYNATNGNDNTSRTGFGVWGDCNAGDCYQYGPWALRVGSPSDVSLRPVTRGVSNP